MTSQELARAAFEASGAKGYTDFARKLGLGPGGERRVKTWLTGENAPSYAQTMMLLDVAGLIGPTRESIGEREDPSAEVLRLLRSLGELVGESVAQTAEALEMLREDHRRRGASGAGRRLASDSR